MSWIIDLIAKLFGKWPYRLNNVFPPNVPPYLGYYSWINSVEPSQRSVATCLIGPDRTHGILVKFRLRIRRAPQRSAMTSGIKAIVSPIAPIQIFRPIVQMITIAMASERFIWWRRAMEGNRDEAVNRIYSRFSVHAEANPEPPVILISDRLQDFSDRSSTMRSMNAFHSPKAGDGIIWGNRYRFPYFRRRGLFSHRADPSRCG